MSIADCVLKAITLSFIFQWTWWPGPGVGPEDRSVYYAPGWTFEKGPWNRLCAWWVSRNNKVPDLIETRQPRQITNYLTETRLDRRKQDWIYGNKTGSTETIGETKNLKWAERNEAWFVKPCKRRRFLPLVSLRCETTGGKSQRHSYFVSRA